jgi:integrase
MKMTKEDLELFIQFKQLMSLQGNMEPVKKKKSRREKGTGSITKLSGKRKRPYLASITAGYTEFEMRQIQRPLAYFKEWKHADKALDIYMLEKDGKCDSGTLIEYIASVEGSLPKKNKVTDISLNEDTFAKKTFRSNCPTFEDIWKKLLNNDLAHLTNRAMMNYRVSFNHFEKLHNRKIDTIKLADIQPYFDELMNKGTSQSKMNNMKIVLNYIFKYACKYDYIEKNYAEYVQFRETLNEDKKKKKSPYTKEVIKKLFKNDNDIIAQSILVMIYTGMRPSELLQLKKENIHLNARYIIGGIKTKNGINRIIPIHECIVKYVKNIMNSELIGMKYSTYLYQYNQFKKTQKFKSTPHSGRHTFATLANEYNLNEFLVKRIMGHSAKDLTKDVYTHVDTQRLIDEIKKIPTLNE